AIRPAATAAHRLVTRRPSSAPLACREQSHKGRIARHPRLQPDQRVPASSETPVTTTAATPSTASAKACAPIGLRSRFLSRLSFVAIACASLAACGTGDDPGLVAEAGSAAAPAALESGMALELDEASIRQAGPGSASPSKTMTVARTNRHSDTTASNRSSTGNSNPVDTAPQVAD